MQPMYFVLYDPFIENGLGSYCNPTCFNLQATMSCKNALSVWIPWPYSSSSMLSR